jgi:cysteine desulfurase/selenocysteine lyase
VHGKPLVYLLSAATSQKSRVIIRRAIVIYEHDYACIGEGHELSNEATKSFEQTRAQIA